LRDFAGLQKDIAMLGIMNKIEIWSKDKWNEFKDNVKDKAKTLPEKLMEIGFYEYMLHIPVLLDEVINQLQCQQNRIYVDATLGDGGHAEEILKKSSPSGILIGIDRDEDSIRFAEKRLYSYRERVFLFRENFRNIKMSLIR